MGGGEPIKEQESNRALLAEAFTQSTHASEVKTKELGVFISTVLQFNHLLAFLIQT